MPTTTKKDLIDMVADATDQRRTTVKRTVQSFLDHVIKELSEGHRIEFRDFGVFEIRDRAPRMAQNPKTLERVPVPAKKTIKFKSGRLMKEALEQGDGNDDGGASRNGQLTAEVKAKAEAKTEAKTEALVASRNGRE